MTLSQFAKKLGRRGGLKRAEKLTPERRREIAASGAKARAESLRNAKKIEENFRYLEAIRGMTPS
jgi:hypothetical protein